MFNLISQPLVTYIQKVSTSITLSLILTLDEPHNEQNRENKSGRDLVIRLKAAKVDSINVMSVLCFEWAFWRVTVFALKNFDYRINQLSDFLIFSTYSVMCLIPFLVQ